MKKKILSIVLICLFVCSSFYAQIFSQSQVLKSGHWVYSALKTIYMEQGKTAFLNTEPMSINEIKFYFSRVNYNSLSESGKDLYNKISDFFSKDARVLNTKDGFDFYANLIVNPEFYYKSNEEVDWSFNYFYKDNILTMPVFLGFGDSLVIETDLSIGKNYFAAKKADSFWNNPFGSNDFEFLFPRFAYFSYGRNFEKWGFNFHIGKEGINIGDTLLGSIIYNKTFETDSYVKVDLFSDYVRYTLNVTQVSNDTNLYLHQIDFNLFEKINFSAFEGVYLNAPLELRFLNPLMIMHQYSSWEEYGYTRHDYYGAGKVCSYLCFMLDYAICDNLRFYALYSQNEIQLPGEKYINKAGALLPDSLGFQSGLELKVPSKNKGYWKAGLEGVYTSPWLYMKASPEWSMLRERRDNLTDKKIYSWIGSPYGPDAFGITVNFGYEKNNKWSCMFDYSLIMQGENCNSVDDFIYDEEKNIYVYYPRVKYYVYGDTVYEECYESAQNMWLTGVIQIENQFSLYGEYIFNPHFRISAKLNYDFIFNNLNIEDNFQHGVELDIAFRYTLMNGLSFK